MTWIIAEAGVNHNGSLKLAKELISHAKETGADAVKFQSFAKASNVISRSAEKAEYQKVLTGTAESQLEMADKLGLSESEHHELSEHARQVGIEMFSTPFDLESVDMLVRLGVARMKVPSGEVTNARLLLKIARSGLPIIMSTGMSNLEEIRTALGVLAFGMLSGDGSPSRAAFEHAFASDEGRRLLRDNVVLLHCTTEYPAPVEDVNLRALDLMRETFDLPVGYSDHTEGTLVSVAAVACGAVVIEKHFTLDRTLPGPDHVASLEPAEFTRMVREIRQVERALGSRTKSAATSEIKNVPIARRSLVAARAIAAGEIFSEENLTEKRPGTGVSPMEIWSYLGKHASRSYDADELIDPSS